MLQNAYAFFQTSSNFTAAFVLPCLGNSDQRSELSFELVAAAFDSFCMLQQLYHALSAFFSDARASAAAFLSAARFADSAALCSAAACFFFSAAFFEDLVLFYAFLALLWLALFLTLLLLFIGWACRAWGWVWWFFHILLQTISDSEGCGMS